MASKFLTPLQAELVDGDRIWQLLSPLIYYSSSLSKVLEVPEGFMTDLSSVPRIPIVYTLWGGRAHHESIIHDAIYRIDFPGKISYNQANKIFLEAMECRGKPRRIRWPMFMGVCIGGKVHYHKRRMDERIV